MMAAITVINIQVASVTRSMGRHSIIVVVGKATTAALGVIRISTSHSPTVRSGNIQQNLTSVPKSQVRLHPFRLLFQLLRQLLSQLQHPHQHRRQRRPQPLHLHQLLLLHHHQHPTHVMMLVMDATSILGFVTKPAATSGRVVVHKRIGAPKVVATPMLRIRALRSLPHRHLLQHLRRQPLWIMQSAYTLLVHIGRSVIFTKRWCKG